MTTNGNKATKIEGSGTEADQALPQANDPFIKAMQKYLNQSRKLDARMRKAVFERQEMGKQWAELPAKVARKLRGTAPKVFGGLAQDGPGACRAPAAEEGQHPDDPRSCCYEECCRGHCRLEQPHADATAPGPQRHGHGDDLVLRQALQGQQDPNTFLQLTLAEIANANWPLTNTVLSQASNAHRGPAAKDPYQSSPYAEARIPSTSPIARESTFGRTGPSQEIPTGHSPWAKLILDHRQLEQEPRRQG